jgi:tetratricopeptide (TPR) repeat protein
MKRIISLAAMLTLAAAVLSAVLLTSSSSIDDRAIRTIADVGVAPIGPGSPNAAPDAAAEFIATAEAQLNRGDSGAAAQSYAEALAIYRDERNVVGQASVAFGLGRMEHFTGQSDGAREKYSQALDLYRQGHDALGQARVLVALGDLAKDTFQWGAAAEFYRRAREVWDTAPIPKSDPHVLLNMAAAPDMPAGEQQARSDLEQAELIYVTIGDDKGLGEVRMLAGALSWNLGNLADARQNYSEALVLFRDSAGPSDLAKATLELARSDLHLGFNLNSAGLMAKAMAFYSEVDDQAGIASVVALEGDLERMQGRMKNARDHYSAAVAALISLNHTDLPAVLYKFAQIEMVLGDPEAARGALEDAIRLYRTFSDVSGEAAATLDLGRLGTQERNLEATSLIATAIGLFQSADDPIGAGRGHLYLAELNVELDPEYARAAYAAADTRFEQAEIPFGQFLAALGIAELEQKSENVEAAGNQFVRAAELLAAMDEPLSEANRFMGLPPVSTLIAARRVADIEYNDGIAVAVPLEIAEAEANQRANLDRFPDHNLEGRALLAVAEARLLGVPVP